MSELAARIRERAERRPVLFVFVVALVVRTVAAIALTITVGMEEKFPDTVGYDALASVWASGTDLSHDFYFNRLGGYVLPLGVLYRLFGDHLFLGQMLAAVMGAVAAGLVSRLILEVSAARWALFGGLIVALFPSQVLWSSVALKDSTVWAITAGMALVVVWAGRSHGWRLAGCGVALAGLLFWMGHLRWPTFIVASWALVVAAALSARTGRIIRVVGALVIASVVPWYVGTGAFGIEFIRSESPAEVRAGNATGDTAFVDEDEAGDVKNDLVHVPRGLGVMLLEPYPWTSFRGFEVRLAQAELFVWYPLLVLAAAGIPTFLRNLRRFAFLGVTAGGVLIVYAVYEGNFGTAFRHRAELVSGLALLAAFGAPVLLGWWQRRTIPQPAPAESVPSPRPSRAQ